MAGLSCRHRLADADRNTLNPYAENKTPRTDPPTDDHPPRTGLRLQSLRKILSA